MAAAGDCQSERRRARLGRCTMAAIKAAIKAGTTTRTMTRAKTGGG